MPLYQCSKSRFIMLAGEALEQLAIRGGVFASYGRQLPEVFHDYIGTCLTHGCPSLVTVGSLPNNPTRGGLGRLFLEEFLDSFLNE
jgi:hypothetical protein